ARSTSMSTSVGMAGGGVADVNYWRLVGSNASHAALCSKPSESAYANTLSQGEVATSKRACRSLRVLALVLAFCPPYRHQDDPKYRQAEARGDSCPRADGGGRSGRDGDARYGQDAASNDQKPGGAIATYFGERGAAAYPRFTASAPIRAQVRMSVTPGSFTLSTRKAIHVGRGCDRYFAIFDTSQSLIALTNAVSAFTSPDRVAGNHPTVPTKPTRPRPQCDHVSVLTSRPVGCAERSWYRTMIAIQPTAAPTKFSHT